MNAPIVQVFVSSTWLDMQPERKAVETALQRLRETRFIGMEYFGSQDETTRQVSLNEVDRSAVYVGLFGGRYGSGITEAEYRRARHRNLPCFIYFKREATITTKMWESDRAKADKLAKFKEELRHEHTASEFTSSDDLAAKVTADLHRWLFDEYLGPLLSQAANGRMSRNDAQDLLDGIRDLTALNQDLLERLRRTGFNIVTANRSVNIGGNVTSSTIITGNGNFVRNR